MVDKEHIEQVTLVSWFYREYPNEKLFAIPNGGKRSITEAKKLVLEGVSKGVPDLFVPRIKLFIEMKRKKGGKLSDDQKEWKEYLIDCRYQVEVCEGYEEAKNIIKKLFTELGK